ncbi:MAG: nucleoside triphosphate pyrophosphohydrolase [Armatimonadota bacterium]
MRDFSELVEIVARLRAPGGCPWDREQTHESMKKHFIEETYEAVDAIDAGDMEDLKGELGDVLLQVLFHTQIASESGSFDVGDVIDGIASKLVRRHPHVFGDAQVETADEVVDRWEKIKSGEKGYERRTSILDGVPRTLPALSRAMDISKKAAKAGFEWPNLGAVVEKLDEEVHELKAELAAERLDRVAEELGDLLFTVVNIARWTGVDPEDALRAMTGRFSARFRQIEEEAERTGRSVSEMPIEEMDAVWDRAKLEK